MGDADGPNTPTEAYKAFIDQLVKDTNGNSERLIREKGIFSKSLDLTYINKFVSSLNEEQQTILADMIRCERESAIHNVLANLTWWILCQDVGLTHKGQPMPVDLSGCGLHGDYIGRLADWEWPNEND